MYPARHIPSSGGAWGGPPSWLSEPPYPTVSSHIPSSGGAWGGFTSLPFPLEWQSNSKMEGLRITEPSDVIEATLAR